MLINPCVVLDANMTTAEVIARLARQGYWLDATHPVVHQVIEESAGCLRLPAEHVAQDLARSFSMVGAAIRRQWYANILWYARPLIEVMQACYRASSENPPLFLALGLREEDSMPLIDAPPAGEVPQKEGVICPRGTAIAIALENWGALPPGFDVVAMPDDAGNFGEVLSLPTSPPLSRGQKDAPTAYAVKPQPVSAWPRIDAPKYVPAQKPFEVIVGLAPTQQVDVIGGKVVIQPPAGAKSVDVEVTLVADGLEAKNGWSRTLKVDVDQPTLAEVRFTLIGRDPPEGAEPVRLTLLEVRYSYDGTICGMATRPLVIGRVNAADLKLPDNHGTPWLTQTGTASHVDVKPDPDAADLTIEIFKSDGNAAKGSYTCRLTSPHSLISSLGPFQIELDDDAKGFAKMIVNQVRTYSNKTIVDNLLVSHGRRIARAMGPGVFAALREVADRVNPSVPAVLLVSAEPYVPWELAYVEPPLDPARPNYLGAQAIVGRWLRGRTGTSDKPPVQPPSWIGVKHMAVMAGMYKAESGLNNLPEAEAEAKALQKTYDAVPLAASLQAVKQLLDARLEHNFQTIGGVEAVHFAGHGDYDPTTPDSAVLYLSDGTPLFASLFGSAHYGGPQSPMFFLNACMAGIGDELLGDMGGFPGNCLDGGFGGVLGALWEVDDKVAHNLAIEFWQRAMPRGGGQPEPVGAVLRDLRAKYMPDPVKAPVTTYLAYVYYGHPRLTLQMVP